MRISWRSEIMLLRIDMSHGADPQRKWNLSKYVTSSWCTLLLLASVFRIGISSVKADIRCYCNLPVCISKNYMCKSSSGLCISQRSKIRGPSWTRYGCIEMFARWSTSLGNGRPICPHREEDEEEALKSVILCCKEDMCNYGQFDEHSRPINKSNSGHFLTLQEGQEKLFSHQQGPWLRSAVISVPVAGGCVLILLIITATRLLKKDVKMQQVPSLLSPTDKEQLSTSRRIFPKSQSSMVVVTNPPPLNRNCVSSASVNVLHQTTLCRHMPVVTVSLDSTCTDSSREKYFVFDV